MANLQEDMDNLFYFLFMENEEKRYREEQEKKASINIELNEKKASGREDSGVSRN